MDKDAHQTSAARRRALPLLLDASQPTAPRLVPRPAANEDQVMSRTPYFTISRRQWRKMPPRTKRAVVEMVQHVFKLWQEGKLPKPPRMRLKP